MIRLDTPDDTAWMYGVVAADQSAALLSYVQLDEPRDDQPAALRVPGLDPATPVPGHERDARPAAAAPAGPGRRPESPAPRSAGARWAGSAWPSRPSAR